MLNRFSFEFNFACTFSKSSSVKKSELLKNPALAFGAILNGFAWRSLKTLSFIFHLPIAEGSVSSTSLYSPDKKYPIIELPLVPSVFLFFKIGPDKPKPTKL